jgi:Zinc carboxypeptidase
MRRTALFAFAAALLVFAASIVPAGAGPNKTASGTNERLQMYVVVADQAGATAITSGGYDVASIEQSPDGLVRLEIVAFPSDRGALDKFGTVRLWRNADGLTSSQLAAQQAAGGFKVWRDYDGPDGLEQYMADLASANPDIIDLVDIGNTHQGRDIWALRLTDEATDGEDEPAVLYSSTIHAREWITTEVNRRLLEWFIKGWREAKPDVVEIMDTTELWFVLVQNPDGYQYSFEVDRLWRKNLNDNDGNGVIDSLDGVDLNRNFPEHWNFDDEGSGTIFSDETYRGPSAASEPETQAMIGLMETIRPVYHISYHSFGQLLLYPFGFQVNTPSADDPVYVAWAGTDTRPAVLGYNPGVGADLYTTNGEQTDFAAAAQGSLAITPELGEGNAGNGFVFPDSEGQVQHEFNINRDFAVAAARSATDPDNPVSPVNIQTQPFYTNFATVDPQKAFNPMSDFTFTHSFNGSDQPVQVLARRDLDNDGDEDDVTLNYSINGNAPVTGVATEEWNGGDRYGGPGDTYYHVVQGHVLDAPEGSDVTVWFTGAGKTSDAWTFHVDQTNANAVLILADTDYTGTSNFPAYPVGTNSPPSLDAYESAVDNAGYGHDVYDVDELGAPDHLGVLAHYDAVIWYTANDLLSRIPGQPGGTGAETQANTMMLEVRAYLNEGGRLLYTGRHAGWQFANAFDYNPVSTPPLCDNVDQTVNDGCLLLSDDFLQYWLGAYLFIEDGGADGDGNSFDVTGLDPPYDAASTDPWTIDQSFDPGRGATNQSFITTSSILKTGTYPQFTSTAPGEWDSDVAGAFSPNSPTHYVYSRRADVRYQRLLHTFTISPGEDELSFFTSYDTEEHWDFLFVEAHTPGQDDWVTLPAIDDQGEPITSNSTGLDADNGSCAAGWADPESPDLLHPHLFQYQGADCGGADFLAEDWNAISGRSPGWQEWNVDLSQFDGGDVEVSISYAQDWATQGLGVWIDDIDGPGTSGDTEFEASGMAGWAVGDPTQIGSAPNPLDWTDPPTEDVGFVEGAMTSMLPSDADFRTLYFGFGFENVVDEADRNELMLLALDYLTAT